VIDLEIQKNNPGSLEDLKKKLKPEQIQKANAVINLVDKKYKIMYERSGNQKQIVYDSDLDVYTGVCSADPRSEQKIITDGKLVLEDVFPSKEGDTRRFTVSNWEYIVIYQHFPGRTPGTIASKYQSVIIRDKDLKFYIQALLKTPLH
jgi:hypothetical protein